MAVARNQGFPGLVLMGVVGSDGGSGLIVQSTGRAFSRLRDTKI